MNSRVSWSVEGIDPSVRERAEAAARRAGMSLNDWLNSTIGDFTPPSFRASPDQRPDMPSREIPEVADIHQRLDSITRQIEQISRPAPRNDAVRGEPGVARQLNDAISRLDARLSQITNPAPAKQDQLQERQCQTEMAERAAAQVYRPSPPLSPVSLGFAAAEIAARQNELENAAPRPAPPRSTPPMAPAIPAGPDFSTLERHLFKITSQIEALQRPDGIEQSIAAFRGELSEIRHAITEAMPRRAIESIENEIRSLSRRIDDNRQSGVDGQALAGIERALSEIREVLSSLTPAEQLAGYDEAIRNLGAKLDLILRANDDPSTVQQLEGAITALRAVVSNVASNDALARLSDDVHMLSSKVDQLSRSADNSDSFAILEQRIAALASTLESRQPPAVTDSSEQLESAVRALSDRLDRMPVGNDNASAFAHLEQRVSYLLERLEASADHRAGNFGRVEDGLHDILRHLETQHASIVALAENDRRAAGPPDSGLIDLVKRELSDIRFGQTETGRHTQDSFGAVQNTLGHVVDRLATIEGDLHAVRSRPVAPQPAPQPAPSPDSGLIDLVKRELSDIRFGQTETGRHTQDSFGAVQNALGHVVDRLATIEGDLHAVRSAPVAPQPAPQLTPPPDSGLIDLVKRELSDIRFGQTETGRHTQDSFGAVQNTLGHVVDRLATIEGDLHAVRSAPVAPQPAPQLAPPPDSGLIDLVKRELSDIRFGQTETGRHTQDSLEAVQNTLGHVVDRLAMIEGDLHTVRSQPVAPQPAPQPAPPQAAPPQAAAPRAEMAPQPKPELPNPAATQLQFATAPREFHAAEPPMPTVAAMMPRAISEILEPAAQPRTAIKPELPPDHPLEPGTRPTARAASPSERIAASESAISEIPAAAGAPVNTSSFIAAARRAAQAAAAAPPADKARSSFKTPTGNRAKEPSGITSRIRSLLVGASVVVIVLGTFQIAMTLLNGGSVLSLPFMENSSEPLPPAPSPAQSPADDVGAKPAMPDPVPPSMTSPTPIDRQSFNSSAPSASDSTASMPIPQTVAISSAPSVSAGDIAAAIPAAQPAPTSGKLTPVQIPTTERLPDAIGGPALRAAALWGDPAAAYEIGVRFAEGKGVAPNFDEAAKWYGRAAQAGMVPAIFRLGTFYEKGLSVNKDVDIARRYYLQAAERGNAKAMHNLAVLDADGGGKGANYKNASQWFRKAADRGVADSQFNLGILYARGIGVEQNLPESFKWFSLAAAQGDTDSARKRDDIAKRLDPQSLAAAKLAIQTFTPEPQPDDAINVASPAGGWDSAPATAAKPAAKPVAIKRAAAR